LFQRTAEAFGNKISQLTDGRITVEVLTVAEFAEKYNKPTDLEPMVWMQSGDCEMSQIHVERIGQWHSPDFFALEMPFLFSSHDHATRVLEGPIGQQLLTNLETTSPARGLAFTYSGGYRCIAFDRAVTTADDLVGLSLVTNMNPISIDTARAFGCTAVPTNKQDRHVPENNYATGLNGNNGIETTIPRFEREARSDTHRYVSNTQHSMYLTSILIAKDFWNKLSAEDQALMQDAALHSSRLERQWSVDEAEETAASQEIQDRIGMVYSDFSTEERAKLAEKVQPLYAKYRDFFSPDLIDGIIRS
jgi:TRAP-type C4-dicarboxylate transport system substrate-binding protein